MKISVQNLSKTLTDAQVRELAHVLQVQALGDFNGSAWVTEQGVEAAESVVFAQQPPPDTAHLEILDTSDEPGALGYHEEQPFKKHTPPGLPEKASARSERGLRADAPHLPLMRVFAKTSKEDGVSVAEVASHEVLEALVDPRPMEEPRLATNTRQGRVYIIEVGDPVQDTAYLVAGQKVANFVLPPYFGLGTGPVDFRGALTNPFSLAPGGYFSFTEIGSEQWQQETGPVEGEVLTEVLSVFDPFDVMLEVATRHWREDERHVGDNKKAAKAVKAWVKAKGLR